MIYSNRKTSHWQNSKTTGHDSALQRYVALVFKPIKKEDRTGSKFLYSSLLEIWEESSVEGWEVHLKGQKLDALMNETGLSPSRNEDSISSHEGGNLLHDTTAVQKNRHHYGWLLWNTQKERVGGLTTGEESKVFVTVSFRDVKGNSYTLPPFRG